MIRIKKGPLKLIRHLLRKDGSENLSLTVHIVDKEGEDNKLLDELVRINSRTWGRLRKEFNNHKGMEVVKSHDRLCTEETQHIEEEYAKGTCLKLHYLLYTIRAKICFKRNFNFEFPYYIALVASEIRIEKKYIRKFRPPEAMFMMATMLAFVVTTAENSLRRRR